MEFVKTQYMDKAQRGYSEYFVKEKKVLEENLSPVPGDRAFLADGSLYFCFDTGVWTKIGSPSETITVKVEGDK